MGLAGTLALGSAVGATVTTGVTAGVTLCAVGMGVAFEIFVGDVTIVAVGSAVGVQVGMGGAMTGILMTPAASAQWPKTSQAVRVTG